MRLSHGLVVLAVVLATGCAATGARNTPQTRYEGMILDTRKLGAEPLANAQKADPAVAAYVAKNGKPDFLVLLPPNNVQLIYYTRSVVAQFHRPSAGAPSVLGELTPLPDAVLGNVPMDIQAGSPGREVGPFGGADCWTVPVGSDACKTCCAGPENCVGSCRARAKK